MSTSDKQRVRQFFHEAMIARKQPQFCRHLKGLASYEPNQFLCTLWAVVYHLKVQAILTSHTEGSLVSASHLGDRVCKVTP